MQVRRWYYQKDKPMIGPGFIPVSRCSSSVSGWLKTAPSCLALSSSSSSRLRLCCCRNTTTLPFFFFFHSLMYHSSLMHSLLFHCFSLPLLGIRALSLARMDDEEEEDAPAPDPAASSCFTLLFRFVQRGASDQSVRLLPAARLSSSLRSPPPPPLPPPLPLCSYKLQ
ncbi:Hypothetical predicted protein [Xyrichtys novacula]|uniref:Uncharacterized protein n=1 Tax=Xyrichtys novacula TaxID=13765 RepID=A0AAV1G3Q5_XYRNO|nr:Hypothetical predicted protein [Xyrichtys novacula]